MIRNERMSRKFNFKELVLVLTIFTMLYMSSSYNIAIISGTLTLGISFICSVLVILVCKKDVINMRLLLIVILLNITVFVTTILTGDAIRDAIIMCSSILIAMIFVTQIKFEKYCIIFTNIIMIIAVYSLVAYVISITFPSIIRLFPSAYYRPTEEVYNLGLTFVNLRHDLIRNMGIFWEAGAYQTYLVFAILLELFVNKTRRFVLVLLAFALLTTWSTTGFINGLIILLIYIIYKNRDSRMKYGKSILAVTILAITIVSIYSVLPKDVQYASIGKISYYLDSDKTQVTSASVRFSATIEPLKAYLKSPILGVGYSGLRESVLDEGHTMITNTFVNWFAAYGIIFGLIFCIGLYNFSKKLEQNASPLLLALIITTIIFSIATQQYLRNISILIFLLYGLSATRISIK